MKKFLLSTSALVGVGLIAAPAGAAEKITLRLGGYMEQYVGWGDSESDPKQAYVATRDLPALNYQGRDYAGFDTISDTEIYFTGSTTLDNGIRVGVQVELESDTHNAGVGGTIDESWLDVSSATLGNLRLGGDDPANALHYVSPWRGISGDFDNWVPADNITKNDNAYDSNSSSDANKVTYFTPRVFGFQLGGSYIPAADGPTATSNTVPNREQGPHSAYALSLQFQEKIMDVSVKAQAAMYHESHNSGIAADNRRGRLSSNYGLVLGYQGWEVGAAYGRTMDKANMVTTALASPDGHHWQAGLAYRPGPWAIGFWYMNNEAEGNVREDGDDKVNVYSLFGEYVLGPGVKLEGMIANVDYDQETGGVNAAQADALENSGGWAVVAGFRLDF